MRDVGLSVCRANPRAAAGFDLRKAKLQRNLQLNSQLSRLSPLDLLESISLLALSGDQISSLSQTHHLRRSTSILSHLSRGSSTAIAAMPSRSRSRDRSATRSPTPTSVRSSRRSRSLHRSISPRSASRSRTPSRSRSPSVRDGRDRRNGTRGRRTRSRSPSKSRSPSRSRSRDGRGRGRGRSYTRSLSRDSVAKKSSKVRDVIGNVFPVALRP